VQGGDWPPVADANGPYSGEVGQIINLDGSASYDPDKVLGDPLADVVSWEWDLDNDGQYDDASGQIIPWSWGSPGTYIVGLKVTDNDQQTDAVDTIVTISRATTPSIPLMGQAAIPMAIITGAAISYWKKKSQ
jgi:hypothetical protein